MPTVTPSVGFTGKGGTIAISTDGTTFTTLKQPQKISQSGQKSNFADITNLSSPDAFNEWLPTTIDSGSLSFSLIADPTDTSQLMLLSAFNAQTKLTVKLQYPPVGTQVTGLLKTFAAYVETATAPTMDVTSASTIDVSLKITGPVSDTAGS